MPLCIRGIWKSSECRSCGILSTDLTEPRAMDSPVSTQRESKLVPDRLTFRPRQGHKNNTLATGKHPCWPIGVRSLRNHREASLTNAKKKKKRVRLRNASAVCCSRQDRFKNGCSQNLKIKEPRWLRAICLPWSLAREKEISVGSSLATTASLGSTASCLLLLFHCGGG